MSLKRITKRIALIALLVIALRYSVAIAWSIGALQAYLDMRLSGDYTQQEADCDIGEFADNVARSIGFSDSDARSIQRSYYEAHCNDE